MKYLIFVNGNWLQVSEQNYIDWNGVKKMIPKAPIKEKDQRVNGWKNYETWVVNLHLSNNRGIYQDTVKLAEYANDKEHLARLLKSYVGKEPTLCTIYQLKIDMVDQDWSKINWEDIAEDWYNEHGQGEAWIDNRQEQGETACH